MSQPGTPPVAPGAMPPWPGPTPAPERSDDVPGWAIGVAVLVMLGMIAAVVLVVLHPTKPVASASYPAQWDSRIAPFARIVEQKRGMIFKHPVKVTFQDPATFEKGVRGDESKLDASDKKEIAQFTGLMRAVGLIGGDVDLFAAFNDATGSGTLAYYSFDGKQVFIRGARLTRSVRPTLVHELTHALQDQYFHIGAREKALDEKDDSTGSSVFDAMVEGDAERVADAYRATLNAKQRKALARSEKVDQADSVTKLAKIPKIVTTIIGSPYALGEAFMDVVATRGGNQAVDTLFRSPPKHESVLLDPFRVPRHDTGATKVPTPKLQAGEKKLESGEFGVLTWYFMLAQRLPVRDALRVADGWGGDSYLDFERGGVACTRIQYAGRTQTDTEQMYGALVQWAGKAPGAPTKVGRNGALVVFESCDPGKAVLVRKDYSEQALDLAATRAYLGVGFLKAGAPVARSRCVANQLIRSYTVPQLNKGLASGDKAMTSTVRHLAVLCG